MSVAHMQPSFRASIVAAGTWLLDKSTWTSHVSALNHYSATDVVYVSSDTPRATPAYIPHYHRRSLQGGRATGIASRALSSQHTMCHFGRRLLGGHPRGNSSTSQPSLSSGGLSVETTAM